MSTSESKPKCILVINPNSSESVTAGLEEVLNAPPNCSLAFYTAPSHAPPSINDVTTAALTATACWEDIKTRSLLDRYDAFLVCCFSDHPLTHILRENTPKPAIGILESAISQALLTGHRFGILSTGSGYKYIRSQDVYSFMGGNSTRYAGLVTTGLGVVELREGERAKVEKGMRDGSAKLAGMGADVILLGCAGMAGMEALVQQGVQYAGYGPVRTIDGARAGVEFLAALLRL